MNIFLCYRYQRHATALYFEKALQQLGHQVISIHSASGKHAGYPANQSLVELIKSGLPEPALAILIDPGGEFFPRLGGIVLPNRDLPGGRPLRF